MIMIDESSAIIPASERVDIARPVVSVDEARRYLAEIKSFVKAELVEDLDYGKIPGTGSKPTLLLPGAQKIGNIFGVRPEYDFLEQPVVNPENGYVEYSIRCRLRRISDNTLLGEGVGSCNSYESHYRWRWIESSLKPSRDEAARMKAQGLGKWTKRSGEWVWLERVENPNLFDVKNVVLKIGKKRAFVDATITMARLSEMFTQDLEDMKANEEVYAEPEPVQERPAPRRKSEAPPPEPAIQVSSPSVSAVAVPEEALAAVAKAEDLFGGKVTRGIPKNEAAEEDGAVILTKAEVGKSGTYQGRPWTKYNIVTEAGNEYSTFDSSVYEDAVYAAENKVPVQLEIRRDKNGRTAVVGIHDASLGKK